jgi:hypothetical protein
VLSSTNSSSVYNLSVLASIPTSARSLLPSQHPASFRLRSLFSLGVHDIAYLESLQKLSQQNDSHTAEAGTGWVACTTDEIIATKPHLYDIIVELPSSSDADTLGSKRKWPHIRTASGMQVKASQRDVFRYKLLHHELWKNRNPPSSAVPYSDMEPNSDADDTPAAAGNRDGDREDADADETSQTSLLPNRPPQDVQAAEEDFADSYDDKMVESTSWSRLAYNGFMWWASAGEQDSYTAAEHDRDRELVGDLSLFPHGVEEALIAYFHRCTVSLFEGIGEVIEGQNGDEENEGERDANGDLTMVVFGKDDVSRLGLDGWSEADCGFLMECVERYWGQECEVRGMMGRRWEVCGVRVGLPC